MIRAGRQMPDGDARAFLMEQKIAAVATTAPDGWPYVIPLTYIYTGDEHLWLHTGLHQGHFLTNLEANPRVCATVSEIGALETGGDYLCQGSQLYRSVVVFGRVEILREDAGRKNWFFDRLREKYVPPAIAAQLRPEYPDLGQIIVYRLDIETLTGKASRGIGH